MRVRMHFISFTGFLDSKTPAPVIDIIKEIPCRLNNGDKIWFDLMVDWSKIPNEQKPYFQNKPIFFVRECHFMEDEDGVYQLVLLRTSIDKAIEDDTSDLVINNFH